MTRSERLLDLLQALRRRKRPVSGAVLAAEIGVSIRTLYRDIASLQAQGAEIAGEPGIGYVLKPGFLLPPLMFSAEEIESLVLGSRWVAARADNRLAAAARDAMAKIAAVLPAAARAELDGSTLMIGPGRNPRAAPGLATIRQAMREERKVELRYRDGQGAASQRVIWPFALGFFDESQVVVAWCQLRQDYRHFRIDRADDLHLLDERYPRRRQILMKEWRAMQGMPPLES